MIRRPPRSTLTYTRFPYPPCVRAHGDVGFRRTDQVDRQPVAPEQLEDLRQEADLLPHADAFHRHQHDAVAAADRLDPGHGLALAIDACARPFRVRSEEHTSELQSLMRTSYAVFCLKKKKTRTSYTCVQFSTQCR